MLPPPVRCIIIEHEEANADFLADLLGSQFPSVQILGIGPANETGALMVSQLRPDLIFLHFRRNTNDPFRWLEMLPRRSFRLIIISDSEEQALAAIRHAALDYLVEPVKMEDLETALQRFRQRTESEPGNKPKRLALNYRQNIILLEPEKILRLETIHGHKTNIVMKDNKDMVITRDLQYFESMLTPYEFMRVHRSFIINLHEILEFMYDKNGGRILMTDGKQVPVALQRKEMFMEWIERKGGK